MRAKDREQYDRKRKRKTDGNPREAVRDNVNISSGSSSISEESRHCGRFQIESVKSGGDIYNNRSTQNGSENGGNTMVPHRDEGKPKVQGDLRSASLLLLQNGKMCGRNRAPATGPVVAFHADDTIAVNATASPSAASEGPRRSSRRNASRMAASNAAHTKGTGRGSRRATAKATDRAGDVTEKHRKRKLKAKGKGVARKRRGRKRKSGRQTKKAKVTVKSMLTIGQQVAAPWFDPGTQAVDCGLRWSDAVVQKAFVGAVPCDSDVYILQFRTDNTERGKVLGERAVPRWLIGTNPAVLPFQVEAIQDGRAHQHRSRTTANPLCHGRHCQIKFEYLVKWLRYNDNDSTWEPDASLPAPAIDEFNAKRRE